MRFHNDSIFLHSKFLGVEDSAVNKGVSHVRRLRIQNIRPWKKIRQPHNLHNVFTNYFFQYLNATLLLPL